MNTIEAAGVLKSDFLGIRNLSILGNAVKIIRETKGIDIDIHTIPLDDKKTFEMLASGETTGTFQLNGSGMTRYLKELKPSSIHDIMRWSRSSVRADGIHPRVHPAQARPVARHLPRPAAQADPRDVVRRHDVPGRRAAHRDPHRRYNWEEADKLRKAMGKKIPEEMAKQKDKFLSGCVKGGLTDAKAQQLWHLIEPFAAYGFNKAHAAAYGMVAYQTSYLKANWPAEYMTAVLTAESETRTRSRPSPGIA